MTKPREPAIFLYVGARGHGKSTRLEKFLSDNHYRNAIVFKEGHNVQDKAFISKGWPVISLEQYKGGKVIVDAGLMPLDKGEQPYTKFLHTVHARFARGIVAIDDASRYEFNDISVDLRPLLTDCRRMFVDLVFVYHGLEDVPIRLFTYVNYIVLFHTNGNPTYKLNKIPRFDEIVRERAKLAARAAKGDKYGCSIIKLSD